MKSTVSRKQPLSKSETGLRRTKDLPNDFPLYCDFNCKYASFSQKDVSGACRRDQAIYCSFLKKYNNKNNKCLVPKK